MNRSFSCRACGAPRGKLLLDLGSQPLANNLLRPEEERHLEPRVPLRLFVCQACWLAQIADLVPPEKLFSEYLYFSSFSDTLLRHAQEATERYRREFALGTRSFVVEIASNDGYLLQNFVRAGVPCLGVEPAANIAQVAREKGVETVEEFFGEKTARGLAARKRRADLILGHNVFAHAPEINDFVAGLHALLAPTGRVVLEFPYAVDFLEHREFDTIYHEHVFYFSLTALAPLFRRQGLEVFHVERLPIHGGSLRLFAGHAGAHAAQPSVAHALGEESRRGLDSLEPYERFAAGVQELKRGLVALLHRLKHEGKSLAAYGASAKGSTLLNFCGLGREMLDFVADRSPYKQGRLTPGTHIPIVPPEELMRRRPDYTLLLTWNFAEEILAQQLAYRQAGGRFIVPIPEVRVT